MTARNRALLGALLVLALLPASASAQATRTWVSGLGEDLNPCSRTAPCKTFAVALSKTAVNGEIDVLDPAGYGTLTIDQGVTLDGGGAFASVLNSGGINAVVIDAPGQDVTLRNLSLNGAGTTCGLRGVFVRDARIVRIERVDIQQQSMAGIFVAPETAPTTVVVQDVDVSRQCGSAAAGIQLVPKNGFTATAMLSRLSLTDQATALTVADGGRALLAGSTLFNNAVGLQTTGSGVIEGHGANVVAGNGVDGALTGDVPSAAKGDPGAAGAPGATGRTGPRGRRGAAGKAPKRLTCRIKGKRATCKAAKQRKAKRAAARRRDAERARR